MGTTDPGGTPQCPEVPVQSRQTNDNSQTKAILLKYTSVSQRFKHKSI